MKLTTKTGIELIRAGENEIQIEKVLLSVFGAERKEQLTLSEIHEMNELFLEYCRNMQSPKNIDDVKLQFNVKIEGVEHAVILSRFFDIDLNVHTEILLSEFNPDEFDRITIFVAAMYAPLIQRMFDIKWDISRVALAVSEALEECPFEDVYSVYAFFLSWKKDLSTNSGLSMKQFLKTYRRRQKEQKRAKATLKLQSTAFLLRSGRRMTVGRRLNFFVNTFLIKTKLFFSNMKKR